MIPKEDVNLAFADTFSALSDPVRREILLMLRSGKLSAGEISEKFDITGAAVSYHLNKLKKAELIRESKYKNYIYYELNTSVFEELWLWFEQFKNNGKDIERNDDDEK